MSSRVRLMLQDFNNGTALVGKSAWAQLQSLYQNWEKAGAAGKAKSREEWVKVSDEYAGAHPFSVTRWIIEPTLAETRRPVQWSGEGFYQVKLVAAPAAKPKSVPALPSGPRWLQALEMWSRLQETHSINYRLFISRDNRKHAWRKSLCNPFYQQYAWKARKPAAAKKAKQAETTRTVRYGNWENNERRFEIPPLPRATRAAQTGEKPAPVKPRVGIWS